MSRIKGQTKADSRAKSEGKQAQNGSKWLGGGKRSRVHGSAKKVDFVRKNGFGQKWETGEP